MSSLTEHSPSPTYLHFINPCVVCEIPFHKLRKQDIQQSHTTHKELSQNEPGQLGFRPSVHICTSGQLRAGPFAISLTLDVSTSLPTG